MFPDAQYVGDEAPGRFGALAARLSGALSRFDHAAADRDLQYDTRHAGRVVPALAGFRRRCRPARRQVVHADLADCNVVAQRDAAGRLSPTGVIDFGDVVRSWLLADLATAITSLLTG